ncbi:MAG: hypothetical protein HOV80_30340 [Polyangiaceae bacterium]|nr:hypothetical protein [Polyangiaceae bacterium]
MSAYRSGPDGAGASDGGVVDQIVRQFADRYAFVRELVQNAVDAGASSVRVVIDDAGPSPVVRVEDDGAGMTLDIIQGPLLTLFSSSKEGQKGKIGRYGVGFMSVFALEPSHVLVETWRKEGSYVVEIGKDHGFEVREGAKRKGSGTHVSMVLEPGKEDRAELSARVLGAARRWCRHVAKPVTVVLPDGEHTVNQKLTLRAPVVVEAKEGGIHALVGCVAGTELMPGDESLEGTGAFAGFYAHGLTLLETTAPPTAIPGVRFKVACADLAHTISRDDVKRDAAFDRAMRVVHRLVRKELLPALEREQATAARSAARTPDAFATAAPVFAAAVAVLKPADVRVPLIEPFRGEPTISLARALKLQEEGRLYSATEPGPLSAELAARGAAIVRVEPGAGPRTSAMLQVLGLAGLPKPEAHLALLATKKPSSREQLLIEQIGSIFGRLGVPLKDVVLASVDEGRSEPSGLLLGPASDGRWIVPEARKHRGPPTLVLKNSHPAVRRAVTASKGRSATALLARLLLVEAFGPITEARSDALLDLAIEVGP